MAQTNIMPTNKSNDQDVRLPTEPKLDPEQFQFDKIDPEKHETLFYLRDDLPRRTLIKDETFQDEFGKQKAKKQTEVIENLINYILELYNQIGFQSTKIIPIESELNKIPAVLVEYTLENQIPFALFLYVWQMLQRLFAQLAIRGYVIAYHNYDTDGTPNSDRDSSQLIEFGGFVDGKEAAVIMTGSRTCDLIAFKYPFDQTTQVTIDQSLPSEIMVIKWVLNFNLVELPTVPKFQAMEQVKSAVKNLEKNLMGSLKFRDQSITWNGALVDLCPVTTFSNLEEEPEILMYIIRNVQLTKTDFEEDWNRMNDDTEEYQLANYKVEKLYIFDVYNNAIRKPNVVIKSQNTIDGEFFDEIPSRHSDHNIPEIKLPVTEKLQPYNVQTSATEDHKNEFYQEQLNSIKPKTPTLKIDSHQHNTNYDDNENEKIPITHFHLQALKSENANNGEHLIRFGHERFRIDRLKLIDLLFFDRYNSLRAPFDLELERQKSEYDLRGRKVPIHYATQAFWKLLSCSPRRLLQCIVATDAKKTQQNLENYFVELRHSSSILKNFEQVFDYEIPNDTWDVDNEGRTITFTDLAVALNSTQTYVQWIYKKDSSLPMCFQNILDRFTIKLESNDQIIKIAKNIYSIVRKALVSKENQYYGHIKKLWLFSRGEVNGWDLIQQVILSDFSNFAQIKTEEKMQAYLERFAIGFIVIQAQIRMYRRYLKLNVSPANQEFNNFSDAFNLPIKDKIVWLLQDEKYTKQSVQLEEERRKQAVEEKEDLLKLMVPMPKSYFWHS